MDLTHACKTIHEAHGKPWKILYIIIDCLNTTERMWRQGNETFVLIVVWFNMQCTFYWLTSGIIIDETTKLGENRTA